MVRCSILLLPVLLFSTVGQTTGQNTTSGDVWKFGSKNTSCEIALDDPNVRGYVKNLLDDGARVIHFRFLSDGREIVRKGTTPSRLYDPFTWTRTAGKHGTVFLMLKEDFRVVTLTVLNIGIKEMFVNLTQTPSDCLSSIDDDKFEIVMREFLLHDFANKTANNSENTLKTDEKICNMFVRGENRNVASFVFECCHVTADGQGKCEELVMDPLLILLLTCVFILNTAAFAYAPLLIPNWFYQEKFQTANYTHTLQKPMNLLVLKTKSWRNYTDMKILKLSELSKGANGQKFSKFKQWLKGIPDEAEQMLKFRGVQFAVRADSIVEKEVAPVGICSVLYKSLILCTIRKKVSLRPFCYARLFPCLRFRWHNLLRSNMVIVLAAIVALPWIVRVIVFYFYESEEIDSRRAAARRHGMTGILTADFLSFLTPVHVLFLMCYVVLVLDGLFLGFVSKNVTKTLKILMRKCLRDMEDCSRTRALGWAIKLLLSPLAKFGVLGLFVLPIYWMFTLPFTIVVMLYFMLPTMNIFVRLIFEIYSKCLCNHSFVRKVSVCSRMKKRASYIVFDLLNFKYLLKMEEPNVEDHSTAGNLQDNLDKEFDNMATAAVDSIETNQTTREDEPFHGEEQEDGKRLNMTRIWGCVAAVVSLLSLVSLVLLARECIVFFVQYLVYTLIGIMLNADYAIQYMAVPFMISLYVKDCFGNVSKRYNQYNSVLHSVLIDRVRNGFQQNTSSEKGFKPNTGYLVPVQNQLGIHRKSEMEIYDGKFKWRAWQMVVFCNRGGKLFYGKEFFFNAIKSENCKGPGSMVSNLSEAARKLLLILVFLLFVVLIVNVFGDEYDVSGFERLLATVITGFLPWALNNFILIGQSDDAVDKSDAEFNMALDGLITDYSEAWSVTDIIPETNPGAKNDLNGNAHVVNETRNGDISNSLNDHVIKNGDLPMAHVSVSSDMPSTLNGHVIMNGDAVEAHNEDVIANNVKLNGNCNEPNETVMASETTPMVRKPEHVTVAEKINIGTDVLRVSQQTTDGKYFSKFQLQKIHKLVILDDVNNHTTTV